MTSPEIADSARSPELVAALVKRLRRSAMALKLGALLTLLGIIAIIAGGTWLFVEAGAIAAKETDFTARAMDISVKKIEHITSRMFQQSRDAAVERLIKAGMTGPESAKILDEFRDATAAQGKIASDIAEHMEKTFTAAATPSDAKVWQTTISTSIARLSAAGLLLFLVQIFITLYRYNSRLGSYYTARADALQLFGNRSLDDLQRFTAILSPDSLDFGELPKPPSEQVMQFARDALGSATKVV